MDRTPGHAKGRRGDRRFRRRRAGQVLRGGALDGSFSATRWTELEQGTDFGAVLSRFRSRKHPRTDDNTLEHTVRIVVVETGALDSSRMCERLRQTETGRFSITVASSLRAAKELLTTVGVELGVLDVGRGRAADLKAVRELHDVDSMVPILAVAATASRSAREAALSAGAVELISRPDAHSRLVASSIHYLVEHHWSAVWHEQFEILLARSPDAVVVVGWNGQIRYANEAAGNLFGAEKGMIDSSVLPVGVREGAPVEITILRRGEDRKAEVRAVHLDWLGERSTLLSIRDVTDQRKLETQLLLSDRLVSLGTLSAGLAHEINNPLTTVVSNLELAAFDLVEFMQRADVPPALLEQLADARDAADRVRVIVRDLQLFSFPDTDERDAVDIHRVIESTLRMVWNEIAACARIVRQFGDPPRVEANAARVGQVLLNLLLNAAQSITPGHREKNEIRISTGTDASGRVVVTITDTGCGMTPQERKRAFTPFFTTKPLGAGTGLGLPICQRIVTGFGGEITVESTVGAGTSFTVALPAVENSEATRPGADASSLVAAPAEAAKVLVIDDEESIVIALVRCLRPRHEVEGVVAASAALERLERGERFDVILCDLMMPQMTGVDLFHEIRRRFPGQEQHMVFITGGAFTPSGRDFIEDVPNRCLFKPFETASLLDVVDDLVRARRD